MTTIQTDIHVDDIGTIFRGTIVDQGIAVNIENASTKKLIFKKPNGTVVCKDAEFTTDGKDGKIEYETEALFLDIAGAWKMSGLVIIPSGGRWTATTVSFTVLESLIC